MNWLFGEKEVPLKERIREWTRELNRKRREIERDINGIKREEEKLKIELKKLKNGPRSALVTMATSLVKARHARDRMMQSSARINSVILTLEHSAAQIRVAQTMQSSTVLLKNMQQLMSIPQLRQVCTAMSKEMMKAGLIEETVNDLMEADEDIQAEAEEEVNKVIDEVLGTVLGGAEAIKGTQVKKQTQQEEEKAEVDVEDDLVARLAGLDTVGQSS